MSQQTGKSAKPSTALFSKRKCANIVLALASKRPNTHASAQAQHILQDAQRTFLQPSLPASVTQAATASSIRLPSAQVNSAHHSGTRTLKSAFCPPPPAFQWSRDVPVADYQFTHSTALLNMKRIKREGRERRRLRSNCREAHRDWDDGMSRT